MDAIKSLLASEKAIFVGLLIIAATVLAVLGKMTVDAWISYTEWMAVVYVGGETIQGASAAIASRGSVTPISSRKKQ